MCFSANASFIAGALLSIVGVASILKAPHRSQRLFAAIPLLFGVQQIVEGMIWLTLPNPNYGFAQKALTHIFLFFAQVIWPVWIPTAFLLLKQRTKRRMVQKILVVIGLVIGLYLFYCLLNYNVAAQIELHHITYLQEHPAVFRELGFVLYAIATVVPPFLSHIRRVWIIGLAVLVSYIISDFYYQHYLLSVWCFFASIISVTIYAVITHLRAMERRKMIIAKLD